MMIAEESLLLLNSRDFPKAFVPSEAWLGGQTASTQVESICYQRAYLWTLAYQGPGQVSILPDGFSICCSSSLFHYPWIFCQIRCHPGSPLPLSSVFRYQREDIKFAPNALGILYGDPTYIQKLVLTALMQRPTKEGNLGYAN